MTLSELILTMMAAATVYPFFMFLLSTYLKGQWQRIIFCISMLVTLCLTMFLQIYLYPFIKPDNLGRIFYIKSVLFYSMWFGSTNILMLIFNQIGNIYTNMSKDIVKFKVKKKTDLF